MARRKRHILTPREWKRLSDDELLNIHIQDLGLHIEGSFLERCISRLHQELDNHGISFKPSCYLTDEWLCPDRVPVIGIPFYLAHPRLKKLEKKAMFEAEGATESSCMKLLRHETGHVLNYAYVLFKRTQWRQHFGRFSEKYGDCYSARPYSKRFVTHLRDNYAQAHPDEDFAETFAVWLTPNSKWRERYRDWPALKKLQYVDRLMKKIADKPPLVAKGETPWSAARMRSTLKAYYDRKQRVLGEEFPGFYDPALKRIFADADNGSSEHADVFLKRWRPHIINMVSGWTGERKYDVHSLLKKLAHRCKKLDLLLQQSEPESLANVTAFVTAVMDNVNRFKQNGTSK